MRTISKKVAKLEAERLSGQKRTNRRNPQFDLFRIIFATLVLLAHAPEITDGNDSREIFSRLTHTGFTFGVIGVDGFFLLSGYLIVQSWMKVPQWQSFLQKRILRIVPGYVVAVLLSTLAVGLLAPASTHFFRNLGMRYAGSILLLTSPITPPVFLGLEIKNLNSSLWTIAYEFRCYLLVLVFGVLGIVSRRRILVGATLLLLISLVSPLIRAYPWHTVYLITGEPTQMLRLTTAFLVGSCFNLFQDKIAYRPSLGIGAVALLVLCVLKQVLLEEGLILFGGYLLFYVGQMNALHLAWMKKVPDISYGVYLYGYPVEALWFWHFRCSPWTALAASVPICYGLGWISWCLVERPMLKLKHRRTAPLPLPEI